MANRQDREFPSTPSSSQQILAGFGKYCDIFISVVRSQRCYLMSDPSGCDGCQILWHNFASLFGDFIFWEKQLSWALEIMKVWAADRSTWWPLKTRPCWRTKQYKSFRWLGVVDSGGCSKQTNVYRASLNSGSGRGLYGEVNVTRFFVLPHHWYVTILTPSLHSPTVLNFRIVLWSLAQDLFQENVTPSCCQLYKSLVHTQCFIIIVTVR